MKSKKGLIIGLVSVVVIAIAVVLVIFLWPKGNDKKEVYTSAIRNSLSVRRVTKKFDVAGSTEKIEKILENHIVKIVFEGSTTGKESETGNMELYAEKDHYYFLIDAIVNGESRYLSGVVQDNKVYMYIKDIFTKWYYYDLDEIMDESNGFDMEAYAEYSKYVEKMEDYLFDSFADVISSKKLEDEKADVTINGKKYSATKYAYTFTGTDVYELIKTFVGKVRNDKEITSQLSELLQSVDLKQNITLNEMFDVIVNQSESFKQLEKVFTYTIYLNGDDEVISTAVSIDIPIGSGSISAALVINSLEENGKHYAQIYATAMGQRILEIVLNQVDDKNIEIIVGSRGQDMLTGKITTTDKNVKFKMTATKNYPGEFDFEINLNFVSELEMNGTYTFNIGGNKGNYNIKMEEIDEFPQVDLSNSAPHSEMTEEELQALEDFAKGESNFFASDSLTVY